MRLRTAALLSLSQRQPIVQLSPEAAFPKRRRACVAHLSCSLGVHFWPSQLPAPRALGRQCVSLWRRTRAGNLSAVSCVARPGPASAVGRNAVRRSHSRAARLLTRREAVRSSRTAQASSPAGWAGGRTDGRTFTSIGCRLAILVAGQRRRRQCQRLEWTRNGDCDDDHGAGVAAPKFIELVASCSLGRQAGGRRAGRRRQRASWTAAATKIAHLLSEPLWPRSPCALVALLRRRQRASCCNTWSGQISPLLSSEWWECRCQRAQTGWPCPRGRRCRRRARKQVRSKRATQAHLSRLIIDNRK